MRIEIMNNSVIEVDKSQIIGINEDKENNEYTVTVKANIFSKNVFVISRERYNALFSELYGTKKQESASDVIKKAENIKNELEEVKAEEEKQQEYQPRKSKRGRPKKHD